MEHGGTWHVCHPNIQETEARGLPVGRYRGYVAGGYTSRPYLRTGGEEKEGGGKEGRGGEEGTEGGGRSEEEEKKEW